MKKIFRSSILYMCFSGMIVILGCTNKYMTSFTPEEVIPRHLDMSYAGPRANVAVGGFDVKAIGATRYFGDGLREMLETALFESRRFNVLDRLDVKGLAAEQVLTDSGMASPGSPKLKGKMAVAELLVYGVITEFEYEASGASLKVDLPEQDKVKEYVEYYSSYSGDTYTSTGDTTYTDTADTTYTSTGDTTSTGTGDTTYTSTGDTTSTGTGDTTYTDTGDTTYTDTGGSAYYTNTGDTTYTDTGDTGYYGGTSGTGSTLSVKASAKAAVRKTHMAIDIRVVDSATGLVVAARRIQGSALSAQEGINAKLGGLKMPTSLSLLQNTPMELAIRDCIYRSVIYLCGGVPRQYFRY